MSTALARLLDVGIKASHRLPPECYPTVAPTSLYHNSHN